MESDSHPESELISLITQIISLETSMDSDTQSKEKLILHVGLSWQGSYTISSRDPDSEPEVEIALLLAQMISLVSSMDLNSLPKPHSELISCITQIISVFNSLSESEPESELVSLVTQLYSLSTSTDTESEPKRETKLVSLITKICAVKKPLPELVSLVNQILSPEASMILDAESKLKPLITRLVAILPSLCSEPDSDLVPLVTQIISLVSSMDLDSQPKSELKSRITQIISFFSSLLETEPESERVSLINEIMRLVISVDPDSEPRRESELISLLKQLYNLKQEPELILLVTQLTSLVKSITSDSESRLIPLVPRLASLLPSMYSEPDPELVSLIFQMMCYVRTMDFDSQPKSKLKTRIIEVISLFSSLSESEPESELVSLINQIMNGPIMHIGMAVISNSAPPRDSESELISLMKQLFSLEPKPELISLINQAISGSRYMNWEKPERFISLCPQIEVKLEEGKFRVTGKVQQRSNKKEKCYQRDVDFYRLTTGDYTAYFRCPTCNGENHGGNVKAPLEVNHPFHRKHSLRLALLIKNSRTRECYCCDEDLAEIFYYCSPCDYAMNIACVEKQPLLSVDNPKWHEHPLVRFLRPTFLTCNLCGLADSRSPIYMCPPCDFVVHLRCISLPSVIRISRHLHRLSFTTSFGDQGDWACGVCRKMIDNDYGGYSCIKEGCSYAAHSRCATQKNVWDGKELDGDPEDIEEEEVEPFVRISDGIIQHFSHEHHHLRLDQDTSRDYDENKQCQACIVPIYYGNFYSCIECDFILHEECANLSRKIYHPIHPHLLTLVGGYGGVVNTANSCSACPWLCTGFFYQCDVEGCNCYKLHVQCATISEPLVHGSHVHPLFLTSKPGEQRTCWVCKDSRDEYSETFNCIECNFALCFKCATLPPRVRYKHDKHMLTLSYGEETSTMTSWCEVCEGKLNPMARFYKCHEYCCVTLHVECLIGGDCYMKPGLSLFHFKGKIDTLPNNRHMSRPICTFCKRRCVEKNVLLCFGSKYCSRECIRFGIKYGE
ncbi:unnamed protein product [Arabidopsis halleri]